jgi:hypothetical protein
MLNGQADLGRINRSERTGRWLVAARLLLPLGWVMGAAGYYGPWIAHPTAALTLSGVDMGEFVKFLPGVLDGTLPVARLLFYLPPLALVISVALLVGSRLLGYPWPVRGVALLLAVPVSLQLLPPAWSPASLRTAEFRPQAIALGICWLLLVGSGLWRQLPAWLAGFLSTLLCLAAMGLSSWQFMVVRPAIGEVYGSPPSVGWGFFLCLIGLAIVAGGSAMLGLGARAKTQGRMH